MRSCSKTGSRRDKVGTISEQKLDKAAISGTPNTVLAFAAGMRRFSFSVRPPRAGHMVTTRRGRAALTAYQAITPSTVNPRPPTTGNATRVFRVTSTNSAFVFLVIGFLVGSRPVNLQKSRSVPLRLHRNFCAGSGTTGSVGQPVPECDHNDAERSPMAPACTIAC